MEFAILTKEMKMTKKVTKTPVANSIRDAIDHLYDQPNVEITIKPNYTDIKGDVFSFFEQLLHGYLWECKFGTYFIAHHPETTQIEDLIRHIESIRLRQSDTKARWAPNQDEEEALLLIDIARVIPRMWD
jgi:hypothetical protein